MATERQIKKIRERARHPKKRAAGGPKADINVTPLIDVVLVLLIIFMVVTPLIVSGVPVEMPRTAHHEKKPDDGKDLFLSITEREDIYFMSVPVQLKDLGKIVDEELRRNPGKTVFVKADSRITYGIARKVMEQLNKINIENIMLGTEEEKQALEAKE